MNPLHSTLFSKVILVCLAALWIVMGLSLVSALTACAGTAPVKPEVRTETNVVMVPTPIPCIDRKDVPSRPAHVPIDPVAATTDQLAAAVVIDVDHLDLYLKLTEKIILNCSTGEPNVK